MLSLGLVLSSAEPAFHAPIHVVLVLVVLTVPPDQFLQSVQRILATIMPLWTPLPASSSRFMAVDALYWGWVLPLPCREDTVTLPAPSVYMMNMLAPAISCVPTPRATHEYEVGAEICRYMLPVVEDAVVPGTPTA